MKLNISIEIDDLDDRTCGEHCPFLQDDECLLFSCDLEETILPKNHVWQDGVSPTRQRTYRCLTFGVE